MVLRMSHADHKQEQLASGAPVPGGRPNAEPGGGRASGAAQRHRS